MTPFYRALVRRLFYFLAGLSLSLTASIAGVLASRRLSVAHLRLPEPPPDLVAPVELALRAPAFAMMSTFLLACACIAAATWVEHRYPFAPA